MADVMLLMSKWISGLLRIHSMNTLLIIRSFCSKGTNYLSNISFHFIYHRINRRSLNLYHPRLFCYLLLHHFVNYCLFTSANYVIESQTVSLNNKNIKEDHTNLHHTSCILWIICCSHNFIDLLESTEELWQWLFNVLESGGKSPLNHTVAS